MPYCTIPERLQYYASKSPDTEALVIVGEDTRTSVTYKELIERSTEMANKFAAFGIRKRDLVAIHDEKTPMWLYCTLGLQMCGAWPLHFFFRRKDGTDVVNLLQSTRCKYLITHPGEDDYFADILQTFATLDYNGKIYSELLPTLDRVLFTKCPIRTKSALTIDSLPLSSALPSDIEPEDIAGIFCSSGSTGAPKLIPRTHVDLIGSYFGNGKEIGFNEGDMLFIERPFTWIAGYPVGIAHGITHVTSTQLFQFKTIKEHMAGTVDILQKENCQHAILFPSVIAELLESRPDMKPIKTIITGGGPVSGKDAEVASCYCEKFVNIYGSTESGNVSHNIVRGNEHMKNFDTGMPFPGMEIKVIQADDCLAKIGERGEVCVRGLFGTTGHLHEVQYWYTKNMIAGKWYRSGDVGYITEDGHLVVTGRMSEAIIVDGNVLSPSDLEDVFMRHPCVEDVVAFAIPDRKLHDVPGVSLLLKPGFKVTKDELLKFFEEERNVILQGTILEYNIQPRKIIFFDEFPKTSSGKVARSAVKEIALKQCDFDDY